MKNFFLLLSLSCILVIVTANEARDTSLGLDPDYQCQEGGGAQPHPEKCWLYYTCYGNATLAELWQCSNDWLFDLKYNGCNYPAQTDCQQRLRPFTCPTESGVFPIHEGACDPRYYVCAGNEAELQNCPVGTTFDVSSTSCIPDESAPCRQITTVKPPDFTCPEPYGYFTDPTTCTQFYKCENDIAYLYHCPPGLYFNEAINQCDWPDNVPSCSGF